MRTYRSGVCCQEYGSKLVEPKSIEEFYIYLADIPRHKLKVFRMLVIENLLRVSNDNISNFKCSKYLNVTKTSHSYTNVPSNSLSICMSYKQFTISMLEFIPITSSIIYLFILICCCNVCYVMYL